MVSQMTPKLLKIGKYTGMLIQQETVTMIVIIEELTTWKYPRNYQRKTRWYI